MTDRDLDPPERPGGPTTPDEATVPGGATAPATASREHGGDRELLARSTQPGTGDDGFVWCETAPTPDRAGDGFEWCEPAGDGSHEPTASDEAGTEPETEAGSAIETGPERETDGTEAGRKNEGRSLPRDLVTTTRVTGADDEAVALLSTLRRDPDGGRWRRAAVELGDE